MDAWYALIGSNTASIPADTAAVASDLEAGKPALNQNDVRASFTRFRILIVGRANSGKTTVLQRVCNTTAWPQVYDSTGQKVYDLNARVQRGYHDISHELVFSSNPGFIFHDSCGFEAGSEEEFEQMKRFVLERATTPKLAERIHAIWYCISVTDHKRSILAAEEKFFAECDTKHVPVIVLFTKADVLNDIAFNELRNQNMSIKTAKKEMYSHGVKLMDDLQEYIHLVLDKCQFPPKGYVQLAEMNKKKGDTTPLLQCTTNALDTQSLQMLLVITQARNMELIVEWAVKR
ncbi:hypothetical protein ID866_8648 [Astraeus odoratus]|nr:hypothetical protein ID866_8648 [Astraeus odoratus]